MLRVEAGCRSKAYDDSVLRRPECLRPMKMSYVILPLSGEYRRMSGLPSYTREWIGRSRPGQDDGLKAPAVHPLSLLPRISSRRRNRPDCPRLDGCTRPPLIGLATRRMTNETHAPDLRCSRCCGTGARANQ